MAELLDYAVQRGDDEAPILVLLHGRGADEGDLGPVGRMLADHATIVTPRAPFPAEPWGYGPGWAWYRFLSGTTPEPESFATGQAQLDALLEALPGLLGIPTAPLLIGGFSQGGTSSLAWALRHPGRARGVVVFSGFLADHPSVRATAETVAGTPIWWGHGTDDTAIPLRAAEAGWQALSAAGADLETHAYPDTGHTITRDELLSAAAFLERVVNRQS